MAILRELGFHEDADVCSDISPGLLIDLGNFELSAGEQKRWPGPDIVTVTGLQFTPHGFIAVNADLPLHAQSRGEIAGILVSMLQKYLGKDFTPVRPIGWFSEV